VHQTDAKNVKKVSQVDKVVITGRILRPKMLTAPVGGDLGGQVIEKAILPYRTTESAPFHSELQYVTHIGTLTDS